MIGCHSINVTFMLFMLKAVIWPDAVSQDHIVKQLCWLCYLIKSLSAIQSVLDIFHVKLEISSFIHRYF